MLCTMAAPLRQRRDADYRALLSVESLPCEWLKVEMSKKRFVLGIVGFHHIYFNLNLNPKYMGSQMLYKQECNIMP